MNLQHIESKIVTAANLRELDVVREIYIELSSEQMKMNRWFDKYLDRFSDKLDQVDRNDPIKKLYNSKFDEYSRISRAMKIAESYMKA